IREKLEAVGLTVEAARSGDEGLRAMQDKRPDIVILDPVLPGPDLTSLIKELQAGGGKPIPVIVLPTPRPATAQTPHAPQPALVLPRSVNLLTDILDSVQTKLGLDKMSALSRGLAFRPDESWLQMSLGSTPELLTSLRRALHEASREGGAPSALSEFYHRIH